ncbi:MAG: M18 family aminopeptidase [Acidimicrobiales bacterium]
MGSPAHSEHLEDLIEYLDSSPSPFHAVANAAERLAAAGFVDVAADERWGPATTGAMLRIGGTLVAWHTGATAGGDAGRGFRIVGAHTDSPNLRVKPRPDTAGPLTRIGVEVYGGVLRNSWLDRDLGLSGRVSVRGPAGVTTHLVHVDDPVARIPQLAIHLNREINDTGLKVDPQAHLPPIWSLGPPRPGGLARYLGDHLGVPAADVVTWELMFHDLTPARVVGADQAMFASGRIDNLVSCHAAVTALVDRTAVGVDAADPIPLVVLFDHEEVGSTSATGAAGPALTSTLERVVASLGGDRTDLHIATARSATLSADGAHATHPNHPGRHDPDHQIALDGGPVLKVNASVRYATDAPGAAAFIECCGRSGVPHQVFVSRSDLACGSTIGPISAAATGITTVDAGVAQLAMHSARETCGAVDPGRFRTVLAEWLSG